MPNKAAKSTKGKSFLAIFSRFIKREAIQKIRQAPIIRKKVRLYGFKYSNITFFEIGMFIPKIMLVANMARCAL